MNKPHKITKADILAASQTLQEYRAGKAQLDRRILDNERWYKLRHNCGGECLGGQLPRSGDALSRSDPDPTSAWLWNAVANKHADAMDNYPEPNILPREPGAAAAAAALSRVIPAVLSANRFEQVYSDVWWYKLKAGTGVYGVFWDADRGEGLGDVGITKLDILNIFWEPGVSDIQQSRNLFLVDLRDNEALEEQYPALKGLLGSSGQTEADVPQYARDDAADTSGKSTVVDWYYKRDGLLHYCKFVNETLLYASENDPAMKDGWYAHGQYPVVFDVLFTEEGSPAGFGYVDVMKPCQRYIDRLSGAVMKNALMASKLRWFVREDGSVSEEEFADFEKDFIHVAGGSVDDGSLRQIVTAPLSGIYLQLLDNKIEELKETSGNRDFSQGGTAGGVTAASAIAALQEAGGKLTRDMVKSSYRAYQDIVYMVLELIRQFYEEGRTFRVAGNPTSPSQGEGGPAGPGGSARRRNQSIVPSTAAAGAIPLSPAGDVPPCEGGIRNASYQFLTFDNSTIRPRAQGDDFGADAGARMPLFDIEVVPQRQSPFNKAAQNELAKELFAMGLFRPEMADQALAVLDMMTFDGKESVVRRIAAAAAGAAAAQMASGKLQMANGGGAAPFGRGIENG